MSIEVAFQRSNGAGVWLGRCGGSWRSSGACWHVKWWSVVLVIIVRPCGAPTAVAECGVVHKQQQGARGLARLSRR